MNSELAISLAQKGADRAYDGPLDVLLAMIRRAQYPIDDLPVAQITARFLEYIRHSPPMDEDLAGQFVETASWLVLLKSRSLLPREDSEAQTPEQELRQVLLDHEMLINAVAFLKERAQYGIGGVAPQEVGREESVTEVSRELSLQDVIESARLAMEALHVAASISTEDAVTVQDQTAWIQMQLKEQPVGKAVDTADWFDSQPCGNGRVALFLALLEEARRGALLLFQPRPLGPLCVKATGYSASLRAS
jgi:segregation and condensation protein A